MISIWMITYNHALYVTQAIEGVLRQEHNKEWELIIGDDFSTDGTVEIINRYREQYPEHIKVLETKHKVGVYRNAMRTLEACTGKYIALCEGDDYWTDPGKIRLQLALMEANPGTAICFHSTEVKHSQGGSKARITNGTQPDVSGIKDLCGENFIYTASACIRRTALQDLPSWLSAAMPLDYPLFVLAARHGDIRFIDRPMAVYRVHDNGMWNPAGRRRHFFKVYRTLKQLDRELGFRYTEIFRKRIARHEFDFLQQLLAAGRFHLARHYHSLLLRKYYHSAPGLYRHLVSYGVRSHLELQP